MAPRKASSSSSSSHQTSISCFFQGRGQPQNAAAAAATATATGTLSTLAHRKRRKKGGPSMFGKCPICQASFPLHKLEYHASACNGENGGSSSSSSSSSASKPPAEKRPRQDIVCEPNNNDNNNNSPSKAAPPTAAAAALKSNLEKHSSHEIPPTVETSKPPMTAAKIAAAANEPIPGLFVYENFITQEEEAQILAELDGESMDYRTEFLPWKSSTFNGKHRGKRWGVHCNLRDRKVSAAENELPHFVQDIILPKLLRLWQQQQQQHQPCGPFTTNKNSSNRRRSTFIPNEANAIDYRRDQGHYLKDHVDDRQLSKEPIANLSLAGDCCMTFTNVKTAATNSSSSSSSSSTRILPKVRQVLLPRRCLQILTGKARYDYSHGIQHRHLLSPRRVSVTMRESPLTAVRTKERLAAAAVGAAATTTRPKAGPTGASSSSSLSMRPNFFASRPTNLPRRVSTGVSSPREAWTEQPIPGLFLFHDFVTEEEERLILQELDRPAQAWKAERHSGNHFEKRWGVDHDLWSPVVRSPKHPLPHFFQTILLPKLKRLPTKVGMQHCVPNEVNSIDYRRHLGHFLKAHADDRKKYKEPICNLSLAGDCIMTYRIECKNRSSILDMEEKRVPLPRRCLQIMTGKARYDYTHGISNKDLLSDRRVSLTMREMHL